jgi:thiol-disulfide isomerase/thioredoxin
VIRSAFVHGLTTAAIVAAGRNPSPKPTPTTGPLDLCDDNPALPYDRPIGLKMRALDAPDFDLTAYRGYAVWINTFASWCAPCNEEQAGVVALAQRYYDRGLRVIGMNYRETDDEVRRYRTKYDLQYPIAMDQTGIFTLAMQRGRTSGDLMFPSHIMIAPNGYLYCYKLGTMDPRELKHKLEAMLAVVTASPSPGPVPTRTPGPTPTPSPAPSPRPLHTP